MGNDKPKRGIKKSPLGGFKGWVKVLWLNLMFKVLEDEIAPRLEGMVPNQPSQERQASDPLLHRSPFL